jgi:hypothetical protein
MSIYDHRPNVRNSFLTRRQMLQRTGMGLGALALGALFPELAGAAANGNARAVMGNSVNTILPKVQQFKHKAKPIIHLLMQCGP